MQIDPQPECHNKFVVLRLHVHSHKLCGHNVLHVQVSERGNLGDQTEEGDEGGFFWCTLSRVDCVHGGEINPRTA